VGNPSYPLEYLHCPIYRCKLSSLSSFTGETKIADQIPFWIKLLYTLYVCAVIPIYFVKYGPVNFLWFSDIALITTVPALWLQSSLLASMMALAILLPELFWNLGFFARLLFGVNLSGLSAYMFDKTRPLYLRLLSLFHIFLPPLLFWMVYKLGYDSRALLFQTLLAWLILPLSYLLTRPAENINWTLGPGPTPQKKFPPLVYLSMLMLLFPLVFYLPTHYLLARFFPKA
jgi:hypothetical protein